MFKNLRSLLSRFANAKGGNFAVTFAILSIPAFGAIGAAVDYSKVFNIESGLQSIVDSSALAGAGYSTSDDALKIAEASRFFKANYSADLTDGAIIPEFSVSGESVTAAATYSVPTSILQVIGVDTLAVSVDATAKAIAGSPACIIALNKTSSAAFSFDGNSSLQAINCAVHANSSSASALRTAGRADVVAAGFCAVGGYSGDGFAPVPRTNCKPVSDPHARLKVPVSDTCLGTEPSLDIKTTGVVLEPGTYCGGIHVMANAEVTLNPGTFIVKNGPFIVQANSVVNGTGGVTVYLDGTDSYFTIISGSVLNITAPTSGTYAGFAFAQNKDASIGLTSNIQGGGTLNIAGRVYLPTQTLEVAGGGDIGLTSGYFALIADKFVVHGNGTVKAEVNSGAYGMPPSTMLTYNNAILID